MHLSSSRFLPAVLMLATAASGFAQNMGTAAPRHATKVQLVVSNPRSDVADEVVSVQLRDVRAALGKDAHSPFVITDVRGCEVPYQLTHDSLLLLNACVQPAGSTTFTIAPGTPTAFPAIVSGRQYPERVDDIAWENDRVAFRLYGPALERTGERSFGYDVWVKNTPEPVVAARYATELGARADIARLSRTDRAAAARLQRATSYHYDHGNGLDCYSVGPTLGCGAPALLVADSLLLPYCYTDFRILDNGPLRFTVALTYATRHVGGKAVTEHRVISLDRGSHFCRTTVSYGPLPAKAAPAAGVVIHGRTGEGNLSIAPHYVAYADPTDNPRAQNGLIFTAALFPGAGVSTTLLPARGTTPAHAVGVGRRGTDKPFTYYFGAAWSRYDCRSFTEWTARCTAYLDALSHPLTVRIGRH